MVTLGVADLARSRDFYENGLGWRRGNEEEKVAFYQLGGMLLGLYNRNELAVDAKVSPEGSGFRGVALAYNTRSKEEVDTVLGEAVKAGGQLIKAAEDVFWGGYSGYFSDPDGHLWEVAWNPFWTLGDDGSVSLES